MKEAWMVEKGLRRLRRRTYAQDGSQTVNEWKTHFDTVGTQSGYQAKFEAELDRAG
jgi:hypothetical protein